MKKRNQIQPGTGIGSMSRPALQKGRIFSVTRYIQVCCNRKEYRQIRSPPRNNRRAIPVIESAAV